MKVRKKINFENSYKYIVTLRRNTMTEQDFDFNQIVFLNPKVEKAIRLGDPASFDESDNTHKEKCPCYGYSPCTCDTYAGCPKE